jgi:hypothetical protein
LNETEFDPHFFLRRCHLHNITGIETPRADESPYPGLRTSAEGPTIGLSRIWFAGVDLPAHCQLILGSTIGRQLFMMGVTQKVRPSEVRSRGYPALSAALQISERLIAVPERLKTASEATSLKAGSSTLMCRRPKIAR